jgi:hypothetical protein
MGFDGLRIMYVVFCQILMYKLSYARTLGCNKCGYVFESKFSSLATYII